MRTTRKQDGTVLCHDGLDVLQGWVSTTKGYWRWHPMLPAQPLGPRRAARLDCLNDAAEAIDTLYPPPPIGDV